MVDWRPSRSTPTSVPPDGIPPGPAALSIYCRWLAHRQLDSNRCVPGSICCAGEKLISYPELTWCDAEEARTEALPMTDSVMQRARLVPTVVAAVALGLPSLFATQLEPADGAYRGYFAIRLAAAGDTAEVVDELNADRVFVPASVLKVFTVAAALEHLGTAYRWHTRLLPRGTIAGSVLDGDLIVEPGADPTWRSTPTNGDQSDALMALAEQLEARGLTRITGDLIVDRHRFPGRPHPVNRAYDDLPYRQGTPAAALSLDEATITIRVTPGERVGAQAVVSAPAGIDIINHTTTVGPDRHGAGTLDFLPLWGTDTLLLRGEYPISEAPFVIAASDPTPELRAAARLRRTLAEVGITLDGNSTARAARRQPDRLGSSAGRVPISSAG